MDSIDGICLISSSGKTLILVQPHDFMIDLGPEVIIVRNESSHIFEYSEGALPSNSELCITRENLKRFCESKLLADHISPTKENNLRLVIGLLTKALVDKSGPKCGSKDNPNYQALSEMLQEYLPTDGLGTPSNKSLSTETLRKNLKKSYDILYDE
jgi:hypothetical protein